MGSDGWDHPPQVCNGDAVSQHIIHNLEHSSSSRNKHPILSRDALSFGDFSFRIIGPMLCFTSSGSFRPCAIHYTNPSPQVLQVHLAETEDAPVRCPGGAAARLDQEIPSLHSGDDCIQASLISSHSYLFTEPLTTIAIPPLRDTRKEALAQPETLLNIQVKSRLYGSLRVRQPTALAGRPLGPRHVFWP